jgi:hypothetical protein
LRNFIDVNFGRQRYHPAFISDVLILRDQEFSMQLFKGMFVIAAIALTGCASSLIGVREGSDRVSLADANQIAACQSKGKITVSVLAQAGILTRYEEDVEANLFQLARNNAVDAGADTVVKSESTEFGKRTFGMYKCRP